MHSADMFLNEQALSHLSHHVLKHAIDRYLWSAE